jgi:hypothetical protein
MGDGLLLAKHSWHSCFHFTLSKEIICCDIITQVRNSVLKE